jgi:hypothetical protein
MEFCEGGERKLTNGRLRIIDHGRGDQDRALAWVLADLFW